MKSLPFALRTLTAAVTAACLLNACGGGGSDSPTAAAATDTPTLASAANDDADTATLAQVDAIMASADASTRALGFTGADDAAAAETARDPSQKKGKDSEKYGLYPGLAQTNLVANKPEFGATIVDPDLKNPWGIAIRPAGFGGHFWFAAAGTGKSIQYVGDVGGTPLFQDALKVVETLGPASGVTFNPGADFVITQPHPNGPIVAPAKFLFANLSGTVTAWTERPLPQGGFDHPADSVTVIDGTARHASFTGVTVAPGNNRLLVADFGAAPALRVYNGAFAEQKPFVNPFHGPKAQPGDFEAFNVQTLGKSVFAMYGRHVGPTDPRPAEGRLVEFDAEGRFVAQWRGRGLLNYPWGVAMAPKDFGLYSGCLLVGNFGDGSLVAFHPKHKVALDYVRDDHGRRVVIDGLWGLQFGNGASLGEANHMYFAAGPNKEADGLVGKLEANPKTLPFIGGISLCR